MRGHPLVALVLVLSLAAPAIAKDNAPQPTNVYSPGGAYVGSTKPDPASGTVNAYDRRGNYTGTAKPDGSGNMNMYDAKGSSPRA